VIRSRQWSIFGAVCGCAHGLKGIDRVHHGRTEWAGSIRLGRDHGLPTYHFCPVIFILFLFDCMDYFFSLLLLLLPFLRVLSAFSLSFPKRAAEDEIERPWMSSSGLD
jgi:hypothetical protein